MCEALSHRPDPRMIQNDVESIFLYSKPFGIHTVHIRQLMVLDNKTVVSQV